MTNKLKIPGYIFIGVFIFVLYFPFIEIITSTFKNGNPITQVAENENMVSALYLSIFVTIITVVISVLIATFASIGLNFFSKKNARKIVTGSKLPLSAPDISMGLGLSILFLFFLGKVSSEADESTRMIFAHLSFGIAYAFIAIYPVARKLGKNLTEASLDLGASNIKTVLKVIIPNLKGAIIAGATITFVMSFDDYIISKMVAPTIENISIYFANSRRISTRLPSMFALSTIMILIAVIAATIVFFLRRGRKKKIWKK